MALYLHSLDETAQRRVRQPFRGKLSRRYFTVVEGHRDEVRQAVVGRLARRRMPLLRLAANDVHSRAMAFNEDRFDLPYVVDLGARFKSRFDGALGVVLGGPELDAGSQNH